MRKITKYSELFRHDSAAPARAHTMSPQETQTQPQASDALHHGAAEQPREEVQGEAVPQHLRARGVQRRAQALRDTGRVTVSAKEPR